MHIPTHILSGWVVANALPMTKRERLCAMIAASVADIDGIGIVLGENAYWMFHHKLGHNVFFGLFVSVALTAVSQRRLLAFVVYFALFHLHLLMDLYGSGIGWPIYYLWPISPHGWKTDDAWELTSWQNRVAFGLLSAITIAIAWRARRTPIESLAPRLDRALVGQFPS